MKTYFIVLQLCCIILVIPLSTPVTYTDVFSSVSHKGIDDNKDDMRERE